MVYLHYLTNSMYNRSNYCNKINEKFKYIFFKNRYPYSLGDFILRQKKHRISYYYQLIFTKIIWCTNCWSPARKLTHFISSLLVYSDSVWNFLMASFNGMIDIQSQGAQRDAKTFAKRIAQGSIGRIGLQEGGLQGRKHV